MAKSDTRRRIVDAAYERFFEFGYNGCGVQDIADAAGVPKGTFYNHFKSKEQLALEVLELYRANLAGSLVTKGESSPLSRLRAHFAHAAERYETAHFKLGCLIGNLGAEISNANPALRQSLRAGLDQWSAAVAVVIRQAQAAGEIGARHDPDRLARVLVNCWEGATLRMKVDEDRRAIDDFFAVSFDPLRT
jgi:TetR/AcrR family transcriptional regulator, transcriptional repressor for nem operon